MAETNDLLFEIGTEELPPKSLRQLQDALKLGIQQQLDTSNLVYGDIRPYATPRRLAILIKNLAASQDDKIIEKRGPSIGVAYADDGKPTKAAEGFARGCGTTVDQLDTMKTEKGEWLYFKEKIKGASIEQLIPKILQQTLASLPVSVRMRWGSSSTEFVRPVHWVVLLYGTQVIPAKILGVSTGRITFGHRFHHPDAIELENPADYCEQLLSSGKIIADYNQRRQKIEEQVINAAKSIDGTALINADLLDEITALVEWPVPVVGRFDQQYLSLPPEVLILTMQSNQKYFPVKDKQGDLLPYFITISNIESTNPNAVKCGNERVIHPRLADAKFFWEQDRKTTLESRVVSLANIVFQHKLGTLADKTHRVEKLAEEIAGILNVDASLAKHAAFLAKADLLTSMVGEFPSLQGIMGRYYALAEGEPPEIATALEEQYLPKQSGGPLPSTKTGQILSLAEKIDTLVGIFSAGLIPTGDKDPYALRRAALGVLRIIIEKKLDLDLPELLDFSIGNYPHNFDPIDTKKAVYEFIIDRLRSYCLDRGYNHDEFDAVLSVKPTKPLDFDLRLHAVKEFTTLPEAESLAGANKRIRNILRKSGIKITTEISVHELVSSEEIKLLEATKSASKTVTPMVQRREYTAALSHLAQLREPVDVFFDEVMVMVDDPLLRQSRLGLLTLIEKLFMQIADLSKLQPITK